jgi:hypothetical protein
MNQPSIARHTVARLTSRRQIIGPRPRRVRRMDPFQPEEARDPPMSDLRETLFGDVPLDRWAAHGDGAPWSSFREATHARANGNDDSARRALEQVIAMQGLESRHYLQAWSALRELGVAPPAHEAKHVFGVVLDVPVESGLDTLAAYEDERARYFNYSGRAIIWEIPGADREIDGLIATLIAAGSELAAAIGPWEGPRPALGAGNTRVSLLTPGGLHFGEGDYEALSGAPIATPTFQAAIALMVALTKRAGGR